MLLFVIYILSFSCSIYSKWPVQTVHKMVQFGARTTPNDVRIVILRNGNVDQRIIRFLDRSICIGELVSMFANGASKCYVHSTVVQDVSFMQPEFLDKTLDTFPYTLCDTIILEMEHCMDSLSTCHCNALNMCTVHHQERFIPLNVTNTVPSTQVPIHRLYNFLHLSN